MQNKNSKCANRPSVSLQGLGCYNCPLWRGRSNNRGKFDEAGYELHYIQDTDDEIGNLQALCASCYIVKVKNYVAAKCNGTVCPDSESESSVETSIDETVETESSVTDTVEDDTIEDDAVEDVLKSMLDNDLDDSTTETDICSSSEISTDTKNRMKMAIFDSDKSKKSLTSIRHKKLK